MKLLVLSDSHGDVDTMIDIVRRERPDAMAHLGDTSRDAEALAAIFPDIPLHAVCGNCDIRPTRPEKLSFLAGPVKVFATHGHLYPDFEGFLNSASLSGAALALSGHTHVAKIEYYPGLTALNPGTVGKGMRRSYAVVDITPEGSISCRVIDIP